jgi:hypothetical protein
LLFVFEHAVHIFCAVNLKKKDTYHICIHTLNVKNFTSPELKYLPFLPHFWTNVLGPSLIEKRVIRKLSYICKLHGVIFHNTISIIVTEARTSNLIFIG